jgi:dimethylamine monooxygenase subunit A
MVPTLYFPFVVPQYLLRMGLAPLGLGESVIERDGGTAAELALKAELRRERSGYYDQALPGSEQAQREVGRVLRLAGETLAEMGRTVAEDLLILRADGGQELIAGHLYFANGWCLDEKLGKPLLDVHAPVPGYAQTLGQPTRNLLERLKPGRPVGRLNWSVKPTDRLDLSSRWSGWLRERCAEVTAENAGERCFLRVERQTLTALPESGCVLFGLHTYQQALGTLSVEHQALVKGVLETAPTEMLEYKGIAPFVEAAVAMLGGRSSRKLPE